MLSSDTADVVICGAGIAGISAAYFLACRAGVKEILIVDPRDPLSLTSDKSSEAYRNWWPDPAMVQLMDRSIDLMEELADECGNCFHMNRRGYLYVTTNRAGAEALLENAEEISKAGSGPLRVYSGEPGEPSYVPHQEHGYAQDLAGADLLLNPDLIQNHFPYLTKNAVAALHVRRAGWLSAQQFGQYLLDQARSAGVKLERGKVAGVEIEHGRVQAVVLEDGRRIRTNIFVNAAGPNLKDVGSLTGVELPVYSEIHLKAMLRDTQEIIPRDAPLVIYADRQMLNWTPEEKQALESENDLRFLLDELSAGGHLRPEGGSSSPIVLLLWDYHGQIVEPAFPIPIDPEYQEIALRGLVSLVPGLNVYLERSQKPNVDGGYYTRTVENRPLIGPMPIEGSYVIGALSGYGIMVSAAAGELLAAWITGGKLPDYAHEFALERYDRPGYLEGFEEDGQL
ncbi:MAG: FAD-binding oxidoreductase [Chloroflexi bacterium]|nr:MAG: FAD-binding oxidoreductase [Chloroflexota bacterium]